MKNYQVIEDKRFKLSHTVWQKRYFNPNAKEDIKEYQFFLENNRWKDRCPFILEWPYLTIIEMVRSKLIDSHIDLMIKNAK